MIGVIVLLYILYLIFILLVVSFFEFDCVNGFLMCFLLFDFFMDGDGFMFIIIECMMFEIIDDQVVEFLFYVFEVLYFLSWKEVIN